MKTRTMYMHTIDGKPASYTDVHGPQIYFASNGHRGRAALLVPTLRQIRREQQAAIAREWRDWSARTPGLNGERPSIARYDYVLVSAPRTTGDR